MGQLSSQRRKVRKTAGGTYMPDKGQVFEVGHCEKYGQQSPYASGCAHSSPFGERTAVGGLADQGCDGSSHSCYAGDA